MKKAIVMFSGGLDSRITAKIIEREGFEVHLCFIKLPFGGGCATKLPEAKKFAEENKFEIYIIDATKNNLFKKYVEIISNPKYGRGTAMNPCKDCKIFIFEQGKKLMKKLKADLIVTGEVLAQRPMSQMKSALMHDEEMAGLKNKILRPLSAKILPETIYEKKGLINRENLYKIHGRQRQAQMKLAREFKIKYPSPSGGCLLCEKEYAKKLKALFKYTNNKPSYEETLFLKQGRMYKKDGLIFAGRNEKENISMEKIAKKINWNIIKDDKVPGPTIVYDKKKDEKLANKIREAFRLKDKKLKKELERFGV